MNKNLKRVFTTILCGLMMLVLQPTVVFAEEEPTAAVPFQGSGTEEDPWQISSAEDLINLASFVNKGNAETYDKENVGLGNFFGYYFKQTTDIDLNGESWEPIGYSGGNNLYFSGNYDGDHHSISNAKSTGKRDSAGYATSGIFGWVVYGSVSNLNVKNANFSAEGQNEYSYVGGITGVAYGSVISDCNVSGSKLESRRTTDNTNCAGGIAGYSTGALFDRCSSVNNTVNAQEYAGGFVGEVDDDEAYNILGKSEYKSKFDNCFVAETNVNVQPDNTGEFGGGFAGEVTASTLNLTNSFVYDTQTNGTRGKGVLAGNLFINASSINAQNSYYGKCTDNAGSELSNNTGDAVSKTAEDFKDQDLVTKLGDAFVLPDGADYPVLKNGPADYSKVDAAIAVANELLSHKDKYEDSTISALQTAVDSVVRNLTVANQSNVDSMAQNIENAIAGLQEKPAPSSDPYIPSVPSTPEPTSTTEPDKPGSEIVEVYRLYNPYSGQHLFTKDTNEYAVLPTHGWIAEGIGWKAAGYSNTPVYRLYNPWSGEHLFTTDKNEYSVLVTHGWIQEGIAFYSDDAKGIEVYRLYNPYNGQHLFTTDANEYKVLPSHGWKQEGIAWYGCK